MKHQNYDELGTSFLNVELDLAITFCQTGLNVHNRDRATCLAEDARKALDSVERIARTLRLTKAAEAEVSGKFAWAAKLLGNLEQRLETM
jgi:hypothetical protein